MDTDDMKASWLEAVAAGQAGEFARHFVPDILEALAESQDRVRVMTEALEFAVESGICDRSCEDGECLHPDMVTKARAALLSPAPSAPKPCCKNPNLHRDPDEKPEGEPCEACGSTDEKHDADAHKEWNQTWAARGGRP